MVYSSTITTSANTTESNADDTTMIVTKGLIWMIEFEFPAGCSGLVHAQIFDGAYQIFPATIGESVRGNGVLLKYDDLYFKDASPYELHIKTWNDDELYDHTIQIRVGVASIEAFMARYLPSITWDKFNTLLADIVAKQDVAKEESVSQVQQELEPLEELPELTEE